MEYFFFFLLAAMAVISALLVILQKDPVYSVMFLIVTLISIAALFLMLSAEFIAVLQVVVYAGAIMVLFLFVVMMLSLTKEKTGIPRQKLWGWVASIVLLILLCNVFIVASFNTPSSANDNFGNVHTLSERLFTHYMLPVEVASVLLLVAIVGAVVLTQTKEK